jgi:hypothetical protein
MSNVMRDAQEIGTLAFEMHGDPATYLQTNVTEFGNVYITLFCRGCRVNVRAEEIHQYIIKTSGEVEKPIPQPELQLHP